MATKSIIEIEILDEKFKAFQQAFEKYQEALKKMPGDWGKVNGAISDLEKKQKGFNKAVNDGGRALKEVASTTGTIAKNLASSVLSVGKWLAFGAIGGGFGLGGLASSASDYRKKAQGLGVTTGQLRGAEVTFGRYINPEATLGNIAEIQADLSRQSILGRLGGQQGQNPAEMLPGIIKNSIAQFKQGGQTQQYAEAMGLTQVFTMQELRRLASLNEKELEKTIKDFEASRKMLEVDDKNAQAWQDFWFKLKESGQKLETSLINNLVKLTPEFTKLSDAVTQMITDFLSSDKFKQSIEEFSKYLASPEFKEDVQSFMNGLKDLADFMIDLLSYLPTKGANIRGDKQAMEGNWYEASKTMGAGSFISAATNKLTGGLVGTSAQNAYLEDLEKKYHLPAGLLDSVWSAESSRGKNMQSKAGAMGHFQFMPETAKEYGLKDPMDFSESAEAAAKKFKNLMRYYKNDTEKALAAYNWGEGNLDKDIKQHGADWKKYLPLETTNYLQKNMGVVVQINNNTGGNTVATANALPGAAQ